MTANWGAHVLFLSGKEVMVPAHFEIPRFFRWVK